ncbi:MAG: hypothetical protein KatS3mg096_577 [Candidatus Parcubacteria bacterium]|nr:MAG: hypothetical protein KatS3mg096_577 [Candidatus Parcubacteria bacterium]
MKNKGKIFVYALLFTILLFLSYKIYYYVKKMKEEQMRNRAFLNQIKNLGRPSIVTVAKKNI